MATKNTPAAGAKGGPQTKVAIIHCPKFITLTNGELVRLFKLHNPLALSAYMILVNDSIFETGEVMTSYARLIELLSPPRPEKGGRPVGPSYPQVRRAIDALIDGGLARRNAVANEAHGVLRLFVKKRKTDKAI